MPIIGKQTPRGTTSFYDFSRNEEAQQPVAAAPQENGANGTPAAPAAPVTPATPVAPVANGAPVNTTPEQQQYQSDVDKMVQWQQNTEAQRRADEQAQNPVATKNGNSSSSSSSNASSTSTKTTTTTVSPYEPFKGDNLGDLVDYIEKERDRVKPETDEEREKREKREKRLDFLSRLRDGLSTFHTAYSYARGVKPMDLTMMSPRARELFERAKAQRDKDADRRLNLALVLQNLKDKDRAWKYQVTEAEQRQKNADRDFDYRKDQDDKGWKWKGKMFDYQEGRDKAKDKKDQDQLDFAKQQHKDRMNLERARLAMQKEAQKQAKQNNPDYTDFFLGEGHGSVRVPKTAINSHNFAIVYNSLPPEYRTAQGAPVYETDAFGKKVIKDHGEPSAEQMAIAVGAFLGDQSIAAKHKDVVRTALKQIGTPTGGNSRTMPGVE